MAGPSGRGLPACSVGVVPTIFCLDFAFAFVLHAFGVRMLARQDAFCAGTKQPGLIFASSAVSGVGSAILLYPFDLVRQMTVPSAHSSFAASTIPYMCVYMGCYFSIRDERASNLQKLGIATGSSSLAAAVELPFDRAKMANAGNMRNAIGTTALRIPLASLLLVSYDHVLLSLNKQ